MNSPFNAPMAANLTDDEWLQYVADPATAQRFERMWRDRGDALLEQQLTLEALEDELLDGQRLADELRQQIDDLKFELEQMKHDAKQ